MASAPTIPDSWALITGDVLTNANAALDHAIYQHVRAQNSSIPPHRIQFPIVDDHDEFAAKTSGRFSAEVLPLIEDAQPFHWKNPAAHPFRMLRKLVNIDKHRELVVASYVMDAFVVGSSELYEVVSTDVLRENATSWITTIVRRLSKRPVSSLATLGTRMSSLSKIEGPRVSGMANITQELYFVRFWRIHVARVDRTLAVIEGGT